MTQDWFIPRFAVAQYLAFCVVLCRSLFVSFLKSINIYVLDLLYHEWHPLWQIQTFGHSIVCPSIYSFVFLLISHDYSLFPLLYPLIAPLMSSSYSLFSDYPFVIFWSHCWYLQTTPLVSSDYPYGIVWLLLRYFLIAL